MHPRPSPGARSRRTAAALTGAGLLLATVGAVAPASAATPAPVDDFTDGRYVVTLVQEPAATYEGGVAGLAATAPADGEKIDGDSREVRRYQRFLQREQDEVAEAADADPEYR
ncbi:hypothetical protein WDZ17_13135 [Pseudokineococcus basanitobsidens]|uniref:Uncharacterized protein n=1 Tax=Pseudokineococcus basanitobsidens TaxID=1926649 RepID=A0ABU8RMG7_9ACTN